jgi:two-component system, chemotaxis family, CheB/CheR fusion protein
MLEDAHRWVLRDFPTLVWYCGPDEPTLTWVNDTWLAFTGRTLEEERGFGFVERIHPDDRDRVLAVFLDHYERRAPYQVEYRMQRHDGVDRWLFELGRPFEDPDGSFGGFFGACYDVTDGHEAMDRLAASEAMSGLLMQTLFHDLGGPLGAATAAVDLLRRRLGDDEETAQVLLLLGQQHERMQHLLEELRHLDQAEHGEADGREVRVALSEVIDELTAALDLDEHGLELDLEPVDVEVDTRLLCRALDNLLRNAVEHTPAGSRIWVRTERLDGHPRITIEDDGPGLPQDHQPLFEPYRRGSEGGSLGLGLSIAKRYLEAIDASLTAGSRPGGGARFVVDLPPRSVSRAAPTGRLPSTTAGSRAGASAGGV